MSKRIRKKKKKFTSPESFKLDIKNGKIKGSSNTPLPNMINKIENLEIELKAERLSKKNLEDLYSNVIDKNIELIKKNEKLNQELAKVHSTITYQLGYQLIHGVKSFGGIMRLPYTLFLLFRRARAVRKKKGNLISNESQSNKIFNKESLVIKKTNSNKRIIKDVINKQQIIKDLFLNGESYKDVRVACIMDEFTFNSYKYECDLKQISRDNWLIDLESFTPQLLFVESAWRGVDGQWHNLVNKNVEELQGIINWCKENSVPTIFWNKEDPIHFQTFLNTATNFDYIFTTDLDCVSSYQEELNNPNVYFLPFACQPVVNNPIELYKREDLFCFAGAYYAKYPERTKDLENIIPMLASFKGVDIYDRNYYKNDPDYKFPDEYKNYIVGTLPFNEIDKAYKGYNFAINLNSIKQSQTMFARRIYELLASNTLTVSNFSRGVRTLFGDLVICSDSGDEIVSRINRLIQNEHDYKKILLLALRKVMLEHTYEQRFNYLLDICFGSSNQKAYLPEITVLTICESELEIRYLIDQFKKQQYPHKKLIIFSGLNLENYSDEGSVIFKNISNSNLVRVGDIVSSKFVTVFSPKDFYGENYLLDLGLATKYSSAIAIGKSSYFEKKDEVLFHNRDEYTLTKKLMISSAIVRKKHIENEYISDYLSKDILDYPRMLAIDRFNYCKGGENLNSQDIKLVTDLVIDKGLSLDTLQSKTLGDKDAKEIGRKVEDCIALSATDLGRLFQKVKVSGVDISFGQAGYILKSFLANNKHDYIYASSFIDLKDYDLVNKVFSIRCDGDVNFDLQITILFFNEKHERIGHKIHNCNELFILNFSDIDVRFIKIGWRVKGSGSAIIHRIVIYPDRHIITRKKVDGHKSIPLEKLSKILKAYESNTISIKCDTHYHISSYLADDKHEYIYSPQNIPISFWENSNEIPLYLDVSPGLDLQIVFLFLDDKKQRIGHQIKYPRMNTTITPVFGTKYIRLGWRVRGSGSCEVKGVHFKHLDLDPDRVFSKSSILVLTNNYPSYDDLYKNAFVHTRVKAYRNEGIELDIFKFSSNDIPVSYYEFEDVDVINGSSSLLEKMLSTGQYKKILVHFLDENMWNVLKEYQDTLKIIVWVHGSEIQPWWRRKFNYEDYTDHQLEEVKLRSAKRESFWKEVLPIRSSNLHFVFVSQQFANEVMADYDIRLLENQYSIIHNFIDTDVFQYQEKDPEMRKKILSIRPFASKTYANDLTVKAILELSKEPFFNELSFTIIGDGPLFDEVTEPLKKFDNVRLEKKFLNQQGIVEEHKKHGVFLVPTRMDTQGVSRGEAMASGLVAITNRVAAIPEFCSEEDSFLADSENYSELVHGIKLLYEDLEIFSRKSFLGFFRVAKQCSYDQTIKKEIQLLI